MLMANTENSRFIVITSLAIAHSMVSIMEKARNTHQINNAGLEAQANSVQGINREGVVERGAIYMECRRNFVASIGGYIIDGCRKFVKGAGQDDQTKEALLCVTCGCHRSFHRKVVLPPPHLRDPRYYIMNYLRSLSLTVLQPRPTTPWLMRPPPLPNYELVEGQGSSASPDEGEEKSDSDSGDEINQPSKINKAGYKRRHGSED